MEYLNQMANKQQFQGPSLLLHFLIYLFVAVICSMVIGFFPEAFAGRYYLNTGIEAYSPAILVTAITLGYLLNRKLGHSAALWVWVAGLVWLTCGIYEESRFWHNTLHSNRLSYILDNFFGPTSKFGGEECLGEFLFTTPAAATLGYSSGAVFGLRSYRKTERHVG
jgi:hypothetical protein